MTPQRHGDIMETLEASLAEVRARRGGDSAEAERLAAIRDEADAYYAGRDAYHDARKAEGAERRQAQEDTFGLEGVEVGTIVWSKAVRGKDGTAAHGGMVVGTGVDERGEQYLLVLDERAAKVTVQVKSEGATAWKGLRPAALRRLYVDDVDTGLTQPSNPSQRVGWARKGLLCAAVGVGGRGGYLSDDDRELIRLALSLADAGR